MAQAVHAGRALTAALESAGIGRRAAVRTRARSMTLGENNRLLARALEEVVRAPGRALQPLVLFGASGMGKSRALEVIAHGLQRRGLARVRRVGVAELARGFGLAVRTGVVARWRAALRGADALLLDDLEQLEGRPALQLELLHTFDALHDAGRQIVVTADRSPRQLLALHPGLRGRLLMGLCVAVDPRSERSRLAIVREEARARGLRLSEPVCAYLAAVLGGSVRRIVDAMARLEGVAGLERLGVAQVRALLGPAGRADAPPRPAGRGAIEAVADTTGVPVTEILGAGRRRKVVEARQLAMYLARRRAGLRLCECARLFDRSPSTIAFAERKLDARLAICPHTRSLLAACEARFEAGLRAGR